MDVDEIECSFVYNGISFVRFEQTDLYGVARSKTIPAQHFKRKAVNGLNFSLGHLGYDPKAGCVEDSAYTAPAGHQYDAVCFPDLETYRKISWSEGTARILIEPMYKGKLVEAHPRVVARRQLENLKEMGFSLLSAHEHEFYLVEKESRKPIDDVVNSRSTIRLAACEGIVYTFLDGLMGAEVDMECAETEYGPGQIAMSYKPAFGIRAADNAHTFKTGIKEMALKNGYMATFMSKPFPNRSGSACHFCHSLWDIPGETPLLYDADRSTGLTPVGEHWIAGLLEHTPAISLLMAPTINCLKRYLPNSFAPSNATWGIDNRTCAIRVKLNGKEGTYIENRLGASGCNPYITLAATVAAGMDGINRKLPLPPCVKETGNAYKLEDIPPGTANVPTDMEEAMRTLQADDVITSALGKEFIECFLAAKRHEILLQEKNEENWEQDLFFEYM
ncbi:lengsin-like [Lytechinus variegatus]|uniref:lengsin-like n=1 Tax=Lytechinus variegatus TaxID=7654 RepID=UPI001BB2C12F|nr:lengsin-like [Lytechinus variegatus]